MNQPLPSPRPDRRKRQPRVLSEEQQLMLDIRWKINNADNGHRLEDLRLLNENRKTNRDTHDLMLAFQKTAPHYSLYTIMRVHDLLKQCDVQQPSTFIDEDAVRIVLELLRKPRGFFSGWDTGSFHEDTARLVTHVLTAGEDRELAAGLVIERKLVSVDDLKLIIAKVRSAHNSLTSGVL